MKTSIIGPTAFQIGDEPVDISYGIAAGGMYAAIHVGSALTLNANGLTDPAALRQLAECALEAAEWLETAKAVA